MWTTAITIQIRSLFLGEGFITIGDRSSWVGLLEGNFSILYLFSIPWEPPISQQFIVFKRPYAAGFRLVEASFRLRGLMDDINFFDLCYLKDQNQFLNFPYAFYCFFEVGFCRRDYKFHRHINVLHAMKKYFLLYSIISRLLHYIINALASLIVSFLVYLVLDSLYLHISVFRFLY